MPVRYIRAIAYVSWWFYLYVMRGMQQTTCLNESYVQFTEAAGHASVQSVIRQSAPVWSDVPGQEKEEIS